MNSGWERSNCEQLRIIPKAKNSHSFSDASPRPSARETLDHPANKRGQQVFCSNTSTLKYRAACSPNRLAQTWHPRFDPSCGSLARHLETRALASYHLSCLTPALYQTGGASRFAFFLAVVLVRYLSCRVATPRCVHGETGFDSTSSRSCLITHSPIGGGRPHAMRNF